MSIVNEVILLCGNISSDINSSSELSKTYLTTNTNTTLNVPILDGVWLYIDDDTNTGGTPFIFTNSMFSGRKRIQDLPEDILESLLPILEIRRKTLKEEEANMKKELLKLANEEEKRKQDRNDKFLESLRNSLKNPKSGWYITEEDLSESVEEGK